jgi:hypothetical protein
MSAQPVRPARLWYWVAGAAVVAAVVWLALGLFLGFRSLSRQVEGFQRVPIPGQAEVSLTEPGGYTVYFEGLGASDEQVPIPPAPLFADDGRWRGGPGPALWWLGDLWLWRPFGAGGGNLPD